jgi:hypothetical protein
VPRSPRSSQPPAPPAPPRSPGRRPFQGTNPASVRPRRPHQRIRASCVKGQVKGGGRVLEPHRIEPVRHPMQVDMLRARRREPRMPSAREASPACVAGGCLWGREPVWGTRKGSGIPTRRGRSKSQSSGTPWGCHAVPLRRWPWLSTAGVPEPWSSQWISTGPVFSVPAVIGACRRACRVARAVRITWSSDQPLPGPARARMAGVSDARHGGGRRYWDSPRSGPRTKPGPAPAAGDNSAAWRWRVLKPFLLGLARRRAALPKAWQAESQLR